jgi:hypothetical protein
VDDFNAWTTVAGSSSLSSAFSSKAMQANHSLGISLMMIPEIKEVAPMPMQARFCIRDRG